MISKTIIFKVNEKQKKTILEASKKSMRSIASICREGLMKKVEEILNDK